jgi:fructose-specific component phosphotransferase system IIB-like protein
VSARAGWLAAEADIVEALRDPTIFLVEKQEHAEDYWRRQAIRAVAALRRLDEENADG